VELSGKKVKLQLLQLLQYYSTKSINNIKYKNIIVNKSAVYVLDIDVYSRIVRYSGSKLFASKFES
jgi:hypothetical protein